MPNRSVLEAFSALGNNATFNVQQFSESTLASISSHINMLRRNGILIRRENFSGDLYNMLDGLRDVNNQPLSKEYRRQIGMTIKRLFPDISIDLKRYKESTRNKKNNILVGDFASDIKRLIEQAAQTIKVVYARDAVEDIGFYDASIALLLTTATSLRINELRQLKLIHLSNIIDGRPINIKSKARSNDRIITNNELAVSVFNALKAQREKVLRFIMTRPMNAARDQQRKRFDDGFILISSSDYMRKKLRELAALLSIHRTSLGFTLFRKFITTFLIDNGAALLAQSMNNHSSINTTFDHYNVVGPEISERAYKRLDELMNEVMPIKPEMKTQTSTFDVKPISK